MRRYHAWRIHLTGGETVLVEGGFEPEMNTRDARRVHIWTDDGCINLVMHADVEKIVRE